MTTLDYAVRADVAGIDEAGRGPLAGPLAVAAVRLDPAAVPAGLDDSKRLSAKRRDQLFEQILAQALDYRIELISVEDIDRLNIFQATLLGMRRALDGLRQRPAEVWIDGNRLPPALPCPGLAIVGGDGLAAAISAASILAKVSRDRIMQDLHAQWPEYGFDRHMGYPTAQHLQQLRRHGPCPAHRRSFAPVRAALQAPPQQVQLKV